MTVAPKYKFPQGEPLFNTTWRAVSEANAGVGVLETDDFHISSTDTDLELEIQSGYLWYPPDETTYNYDGGTVTLEEGGEYDRWDTLYFDTATSSVEVRKGTEETNPEPEDIQDGEAFLGYVYVPEGATDTADDNVHTWRSMALQAANLRLDDEADDFQGANVEDALTEVIREAGDPLNGPLDLSEFDGSAPLDLGENPGAFGAIVDALVDGYASEGSEQSYTLNLDGEPFLKVYAEADGEEGVENLRVEVARTLLVEDDVEDENGTTIWDSEEDEVPQDQLGGPAAEFSGFPIPLGTDTDRDLNGEDLTDDEGPGTLYDASEEEFPRNVLDPLKASAVVDVSEYDTDGEELLLVDTDTIGEEVSITLSSSDVDEGRTLVIVDVGGAAADNPIVLEPEGSEEINGNSSESIGTDYTGREFVSDGEDWFTPAPAPTLPERQVEGAESGNVSEGAQGILIADHLQDEETLEVYKAIFMKSTGEPVPEDLNLIIATLNNEGGYNEEEVIYAGDGSTVWDGDENSIGEPLASYTHSGGGSTVAVLVDNGTAEDQDIMVKITGERV